MGYLMRIKIAARSSFNRMPGLSRMLLLTFGYALLCTVPTPVDAANDRELFLVDPMASNGTKTSFSFQAQGYTKDHKSMCTISLYGIPENTAAGDRDMLLTSRFFKDRFNDMMKNIDPEMSVMITSVVILSQTLGTMVDRRQLSGVSSDRRLAKPIKYSNSPAVVKWLCKKCKSDNKDARRVLQEAMVESDFVSAFANDLKDGDSTYLANALEATQCLRITCDNERVIETENCATFGL
jgi:hypothetical protein